MGGLDDDEGMIQLGGGCPLHGEDHMTECGVCGAEFCTRCYPNSALCPDCAELSEDELEEETLLADDERKNPEKDETDRLLSEADQLPMDELMAEVEESDGSEPEEVPAESKAARPARSAKAKPSGAAAKSSRAPKRSSAPPAARKSPKKKSANRRTAAPTSASRPKAARRRSRPKAR